MTVVSPACACELRCPHHPDGKCPRFAVPNRKLCEACAEASQSERVRLEAEYEQRKAYLVETQTGFEDGELTDPELIDVFNRLKAIERKLG
jgi:hypothetical protein